MPALGAALYREVEANVTDQKWHTLLYGGYYGKEPDVCYLRGLIIAIGYLAYARAGLTMDVNMTAFGMMRKNSENSDHVDEAVLIRNVNEARKLGDECLRQCVKYIQECCAPKKLNSISKRKWISVRKRGY